MHTQQAAEIAYFKLAAARSFRFHNVPTTRILDLKAEQVLKVTDSRDITYFRNRPDTVTETDAEGIPLNAPAPGTITTPNALSKRAWRQPGQVQPTVAGRQVPGTRVVGSPMPAAQNNAAAQGLSRYTQTPPGLVTKGQQPAVVGQGPVAVSQVSYGAPVASAAPTASAPLLEVRLGEVIQPPSAPVLMHPGASASAPEEPLSDDVKLLQQQVRDLRQVIASKNQEVGAAPFITEDVPQVLATPVVERPAAAPASVAATAPVLADGSVDPAYIAQPIPPGGIPQRPVVLGPGGQPAPVHAAIQYAPAGAGASASPSLQQKRAEGGIGDAHDAQQALEQAGFAGQVVETPIETVSNDGKPAGEF